jgi:hypothetical protein
VLLDDAGTIVRHPRLDESGHVSGRPKVHYGRIGSGGKLINSAAERTRLARQYRLIGFDMEGDGIADTAYLQGVDWFMVRGVSDYGSGKNDQWHRYASLVAAAFVHALLGQVAPLDPPARRLRGGDPPIEAQHREKIVDTLLAVRTMSDTYGRERVIRALVARYGIRIPRARDAYHDVDALVQSLGQIPDGLGALYRALHGIEGDSRPLRQLGALLEEIAAQTP